MSETAHHAKNQLRSLADPWHSQPVPFAAAFVTVHIMLGAIGLIAPGFAFGDVTSVYRFWSDMLLSGTTWYGISVPWVYPVVAMVPMLIPHLLTSVVDYTVAWIYLMVVLNLLAVMALTNWGRNYRLLWLAWWWLGFLLLLGPVSIGRIDAVGVPLAIIGLMLAWRHPVFSGVMLAFATWIKVWPVALGMGLVALSRRRLSILTGALAFTGLVLLVGLLLGGGANLFSFVTQQGERALQVEAVLATPWVWGSYLGWNDTFIYYNDEIYTNQVNGPGVELTGSLATPLMVLSLVGVVLLAWRAKQRGVGTRFLLPPTLMALVVTLIVLNKVGSPQFISWLAVPVMVGLAYRRWDFFGVTAVGMVTALLTHIIYPYWYGYLLNPHLWMVGVITVRNLLLVVLLVWAVYDIARLGASHRAFAMSPTPGGRGAS